MIRMIKKKSWQQRISFCILIFSLFIPLTAHAATLFEAAGDGDIKTVIDLLDKGADVNEQNDGMTALMVAAIRRLEMTRFLLDKGADIGRKNNDGETVLMMSVVFNDNTEIVELLLDRGAQINEQANNGMIALGWAAIWGSSEVARFLIDKGADIDTAMVGLEKYNSGDNSFATSKATEGLEMLKRMKR